MAGEKFKIDFVSNGKGVKPINEPIGFDAVPFTFKQDSKRYGRDKFFGGDNENEFEFVRHRNHEIDNLLYDFETTGFETEDKLIIEKDGIENIVGDLDFQYATTDQLNSFKCKVIQDSNQAIIKRRSELMVDVFSDEDIDGNAIEPLITENVLVRSKPIIQSSSWETPEAFTKTMNVDAATFESDTEYFVLNPCVSLTSQEIDDSLTFFQNYRAVETLGTAKAIKENDFILVEAVNNLRKIEINITDLDFSITGRKEYGGDAYGDYELELRYGSDWETATSIKFFSGRLRDGDVYTNKNKYTQEIDFLNRGDKIWLYYYFKLRESGIGSASFSVDCIINSMNVDIKVSSIAYNTIVPSIRLKDGASQVVKSISGLTTSFPFAEPNGEMYNQRIFSGNMLRNLTDRAFNISFEDIEKWLPEINGDYQIQNDGTVFFGLYKDFYQNKEIGVFTGVRFDTYQKSINERHAINQFSYNYKKYQSQKEEEVENSFDISHGESQWNVQNRFVENKKEVEVPFVRCSFYLDEQRRKAFDLNENTSTQDDDTIFILDTKELNQALDFTETDFLQHTFDQDTNYLKLTNTGDFSFVLLGLAVNEQFSISNDLNAGIYNIVEVTERYITLDSGSGDIANNGERNTQFTYIVSTNTAPFISWSGEGFDYIDGIVDSENFANLKYTIKRNITKFYNEYLATCNLFAKKPIKNTEYNNNGTLSMSYEGVQTVESGEFTPTNPILSPYMHNVTAITDFNTFMELQNKIKSDRGYVRVLDGNSFFIKGFIKEATFKNIDEKGELNMIIEEKYETSLINLVHDTSIGYITVNDEYKIRKIKYKIKDEKVYIMDEFGLLMYTPVFWQKVTINSAVSETKEDLVKSLTLLEK